ncbi:MAG: hypothetical protein J0L84_09995 [Verrucomicrobia bacterium]|nr:hypothetical protein [Verrucomicrobiota bacterium]
MFSAHVESVKFLQRVKDTIGDFVGATREQIVQEDGTVVEALKMGNRAQFVDRMRELAVAEGMGPLEPEDAGTVRDITSEQRLGLIFDVQTQAATRFGDWKQGLDPDVLDEFPAQRFIREVGVEAPRKSHEANEGEVRLKTDLEFWLAMNSPEIGGFGVPWGPWGFNSGMGVEDVDRGEAEALGLLEPGQKVETPEARFNEHLKASVTNLDPEMQDLLKGRFGSQIQIKDGAAWWKGDRAGKAGAGVAPRRRAPEPPPEPPAPVGPPPFPDSLGKLETVRKLGGSTGAELVRDPGSGALFVRKQGNSAAHVQEEHTANEFYRALGVPVPEGRIYNEAGAPTQLTRFVEGQPLGDYLKNAGPVEAAAVKAKIAEHFAADALLGNWDVAGMGLDNILVTADGTPLRIDNGGSLRFRAQGAAKTADQWDAHATELWTLRDPKLNPQTAQLFGGLDAFQIARQIQRMDGQALLAAAPEDLRPVLAARLENLKAIAAKSLEFEATNFVPAHADEVTRHMMGMRKAETFTGLAPALKQAKPGDVTLFDKDGLAFDHLRTTAPAAAVQSSKDRVIYDAVLKAVKTVNAHHAKGDTQYNQVTLAAAMELKPELEKLAGSSGPYQGMAKGYLQTLAHIEKAKGDVSKNIPKFDKIPVSLPGEGKKKGSQNSVTKELADYINANGGSWEIIAEWAAAQGGSSASEASNAASAFLLSRLQGISKGEVWSSGSTGAAARKLWGDKFERTWEMFHAGVQEILGRLEFNGNDTARRAIRILRTEQSKGTVPFGKGEKGRYARRVNASGSVFAPVFSGTNTVTVVPHTRITGTYFLERIPGTPKRLLLR